LTRYKVYLTQNAENDLFDIYNYIYLNDSEKNAEKLFKNLFNKCRTLERFPQRGRVPPELKILDINDFLEINYLPYRIIYQIIQKDIFIHCILDGRREIQKLLQERLLR